MLFISFPYSQSLFWTEKNLQNLGHKGIIGSRSSWSFLMLPVWCTTVEMWVGREENSLCNLPTIIKCRKTQLLQPSKNAPKPGWNVGLCLWDNMCILSPSKAMIFIILTEVIVIITKVPPFDHNQSAYHNRFVSNGPFLTTKSWPITFIQHSPPKTNPINYLKRKQIEMVII